MIRILVKMQSKNTSIYKTRIFSTCLRFTAREFPIGINFFKWTNILFHISRDGSTIHHRSTATNASFMLATRTNSTRIVRAQTKNSTSDVSRVSQPTDDAVLEQLIDVSKNNNDISANRQARVILRYDSENNENVDTQNMPNNHD